MLAILLESTSMTAIVRWLSLSLRLLAFAIVFGMLVSEIHGAEEPPFREVASLGRGINILGYDGLWEGGKNAPFRPENLTMIKHAGFSHVRINFFGFKHMNSENVLDEIVLTRLDAVIEEVLGRKLIPILDEHDSEFCQRYLSSCAEKLKSFWKQMSSRYSAKYPGLIFEILNEPGGQMTSAMWNSLLDETLNIIRETNPARPVIVAALNTEDVTIDQLVLPVSDRNLIATVHYYAPVEFTHQGAPWSRLFSKIGPLDWGNADDEAKVISDFGKINLWSEREKRPIYLGEFGVFERAPAKSRSRYLSYIARNAERLGWAWAYWQFDHDFAAFNTNQQGWNREILNALVPR
jgi:endoglucanase